MALTKADCGTTAGFAGALTEAIGAEAGMDLTLGCGAKGGTPEGFMPLARSLAESATGAGAAGKINTNTPSRLKEAWGLASTTASLLAMRDLRVSGLPGF